jgi:TolC family type I secretion outer membrane protein
MKIHKIKIRFLRSWVAKSLGAILAFLVIESPVTADPKSDLFQPDLFQTGKALQKRTPDLNDPLGRECPLPAGALSLSAAVDIALCRNPTTRSSWAAAREQAAALGIAESALLPTVEGTGDKTRTYGQHVDVSGNTVTTPQNTRDVALDFSWTLYDFGGIGANIKSNRLLLDAAAKTLNSVSQQTVLAVVQAFYGVVSADASVVAAQSTEDAYARSVEIANALQKGGVASLADVLQAETAYDQAILARVQYQYLADAAHGALSVAIGSPADQALKLEVQPVPASVPPFAARMADLMAQAKLQRPDLAAAVAQRDAAAANVTVARAVGRPSISIQGSRSGSDTTGVPNQNYNQVGIYVTVPIFTGFKVAYGVRQAQASLESSEVNVDKIRLQVSTDVWDAYYSLVSANQQLSATATLVKTANQNQEVALGRYQGGIGTILDLLTAQAEAATAAQARINAELAWEVARGQLALALGHLSRAEPLVSEPALP